MELRVFTEPYHGATYDELLRAARHSEDRGFDGSLSSPQISAQISAHMPMNRTRSPHSRDMSSTSDVSMATGPG